MNWTREAQIQHLAQLHEESRYYRRFHHTLFSVSMATYTGLMILQTNFLMVIGTNPITLSGGALQVVKWVIPIVILLILPGLLIYMFINWHFVQGNIRANIYALEKIMKFPQKYLEDKKYENFTKKNCLQKFCIGRGHIIFIIILVIMVVINVVLFLFLSSSIFLVLPLASV